MAPDICSIDQCTPSDLEAFVALVRDGGAVSAAFVREGLRRASHLAFVRDQLGAVIAVGALKRPTSNYRDRVFHAARATCEPARFTIELGYVSVDMPYRNRGLSHALVTALLPHAHGGNVFATTRADKPYMQQTLETAGFKREGQPYPSEDGSYELLLYVRCADSFDPAPAA